MKLKYTVYILYNFNSERFYVGMTEDLNRRLEEHEKAKLSHRNKGFDNIFIEIYCNKQDALRREKYLKTSKGKFTLKAMLKETLKSMHT